MKKSLIALAALATVATAAQAQSSVTVYGVLDTGIVNVSNVSAAGGGTGVSGTVQGLQNGILSTPRLGFRGTEDLGGGLKANFNLENEFLNTTGAQISTLFSRAAWVGLEGSFGAVRLGRQNTDAYDIAAKFDPMGAGNLGGIITTADTQLANVVYSGNNKYAVGYANGAQGTGNRYNSYGNTRWDNAVRYTTPLVSGLQASVTYRLGGVAGDNSAGSGLTGSLSYTQGNLELATSYLEEKVGLATLAGTADYGLAQGADAFNHYGLYARYNFGVAKVTIGHTETKGKGTGGAAYKTDFAGVNVPLTAALTLNTNYARIKNQAANQEPTQVALGLNYALSKRTTLYGVYAATRQDNGSALNLASTTKFNGSVAGVAPGVGKDQTAFGLGVRHTF